MQRRLTAFVVTVALVFGVAACSSNRVPPIVQITQPALETFAVPNLPTVELTATQIEPDTFNLWLAATATALKEAAQPASDTLVFPTVLSNTQPRLTCKWSVGKPSTITHEFPGFTYCPTSEEGVHDQGVIVYTEPFARKRWTSLVNKYGHDRARDAFTALVAYWTGMQLVQSHHPGNITANGTGQLGACYAGILVSPRSAPDPVDKRAYDFQHDGVKWLLSFYHQHPDDRMVERRLAAYQEGSTHLDVARCRNKYSLR